MCLVRDIGMGSQPIARFVRDTSGAVALILGLALPALTMVVGASVEYGRLVHRRAQLQKAADTGALAAGKELSLANVSETQAQSVATAAAMASLSEGRPTGTNAQVAAAVLNERTTVSVTIDETVANIFGKVLSLPTSQLHVKAVAKVSGKMRLCVLATDPKTTQALRLDQNAKMTAKGCSVYSDSSDKKGLVAYQAAYLQAENICTAGGYDGKAGVNISPAPITDCPQIPDPLTDRMPPSAIGCDFGSLAPLTPYVVNGGVKALVPGVYCGGLKVTNGAVATLEQGTYIFNQGPLTVDKKSSLSGDYVGLYFKGDKAMFDFSPDSGISLSAPKTGDMAGILVFEDRTAPVGRHFKISSNNARKLLGTIYLPQGSLYIDANNPVADKSAYTVVVARTIQLESGPDLVLNANYSGTDIPVPKGVGPIGGAVGLAE